MSAAMRLRRLDDERNVVELKRGPSVSFANSGLPGRDIAEGIAAAPDPGLARRPIPPRCAGAARGQGNSGEREVRPRA